MNPELLRAPFPYFGGKSTVAEEVWKRFGAVQNYIEPFFGSGAVLLSAPWPVNRAETVNDKDGFIANFWRAVSADPEQVSHYVDWPVNENDLHARHAWMTGQRDSLAVKLEGDPEWYDPKIAGWWCWGMSCWIGSGFCNGSGPWHVENGQLINKRVESTKKTGVVRGCIKMDRGTGVNRKRVMLHGSGITGKTAIKVWFHTLSERLRQVRVCCGDWKRVCNSYTVTTRGGLTGVFLDPPYSKEANRADLYTQEDKQVAHEVRSWCRERGEDNLMRIALCGYEGEGHEVLEKLGWTVFKWKAAGGYESQGSKEKETINCERERIWFSPRCITPRKQGFFF